MLDVIKGLERSMVSLQKRISARRKNRKDSRRLERIPGVGVLSATCLGATLSDGSVCSSGRYFAASPGLVPRRHSTGRKRNLAVSPNATIRFSALCWTKDRYPC